MAISRNEPAPDRDNLADVVRSEQEVDIGLETREAGSLRVRKRVEHEHVSEVVPRDIEHADMERVAVEEGDEGEVRTLEDGSVSIPVFEERLVIEKRLVVRERVVVRKRTVVDEQVVETDLARERVEIDADPEVSGRVVDHREDGTQSS